MKQEYKELLLKDLCARLPYGVVIEHEGDLSRLDTIFMCDSISISSTSMDKNLSYNLDLNEIKPYLFPLSSMTEEQRKELQKLYFDYVSDEIFNDTEFVYHYDCIHLIDWLNKNHFDYRGLIEKDLAIDATGLNIY